MITAIEASRVEVLKVNSTDVAKACGNFYDAVIAGRIRHGGARPLARAVAAGTKRELVAVMNWAKLL